MTDVEHAGDPERIEPDWPRERPRRLFDPGRRFLAAHRAVARGGVLRRLALVRHRLWSIIGQIDIAPGTRIGGGLMMPHPNGIVVHPDAVIGPNCLLMQQVTIGVDGRRPGAPVLGGHVDIGAGARILGPIMIGDHALIGANAVVTRDVPARAIMAGVPARQIGTR